MPAHFLCTFVLLLPLLYCKPLDKTQHSNLNIKVQAKDVDCVGIKTYGAKRPVKKRNFEICVVDPRSCDHCIPKSNCGDFCVDQHASCGNACGESSEDVFYHPATIQHMIENHHYCEPGNEKCEANPHHQATTTDSHYDGTVMHESQLQSNIIASDHDFRTNYVASDHPLKPSTVAAADHDFGPSNNVASDHDLSEHTDGNMIAHGSVVSASHVVEPIHHHLHHHHHQHHHRNDVTSNVYNAPPHESLLTNLGPAVEPSAQSPSEQLLSHEEHVQSPSELLSHEESVSLHSNDLPKGVEDAAVLSKINPKLEHNELEHNDAVFTLAQTDPSFTEGRAHPHDSIGMQHELAIPPPNDVSFTVNDPVASHNVGGSLPMVDDHSQSFHDHSHLFHDDNMVSQQQQGSISPVAPRDPLISETQSYTSNLPPPSQSYTSPLAPPSQSYTAQLPPPSQSHVMAPDTVSSPLNPLVVDTTETHEYSAHVPAQGISAVNAQGISAVNNINSVHDSDISHGVPQGHVLDNVVPHGSELVTHAIPLNHGQELSPNAKHVCNCNCNKESVQSIPKVLGIETVQYSYNTGNRFPCGLCTSVDHRTPATCTAECCRCKTYCEHA